MDTWTDYAGIAGLVAAALIAAWMLLGNRTSTSSAHRGARTAPQPGFTRTGRHRGAAPSRRLLHRIRPR